MKPLLLEMQAFGPFAGRQTIDFGQLGDKTFFLIHGPTGSGKTTILDGICWALFGDSSGGEREGRGMRSQHADAHVLTEAVFDFALGTERYRVRRQPEQQRPAQRGGGLVNQAQKAELWRFDGEDETPLASGWSKVTEAVVRLLGFESRQFRQVIMLPQGRFRDFLIASTQEREKILQTLFGTELYKRIEDALRESANALQRQADAVTIQRKALLEQAQAPDEAALAARVQQQDAAVIAGQAAEAAATQAAAQADEVLGKARLVAERFAELDKAIQDQQTQCGQQAGWDERRRQLEAARRAAAIRPYEAAVREQRQLHDAEAARARQLAGEQAAAVAAKTCADAALAAEQARAPETDRATARIAELEALAGRVTSLAAVRTQHVAAVKAEAAARTAQQRALDGVKKARDEAQRLERELQARRLEAAGLAGHRASRLHLGGLLEQAVTLALRGRERQAAAQATLQARAAFDAAAKARAAAGEQREATHRAWIAGQAARLARELVAGEACPVCGALEHPAPAHADGRLVDDSVLNAVEAAQVAAEKALRDAERSLSAAQETERRLDDQIAAARQALGEAVTTPEAELRAQAATVDKLLAVAEAATAGLAALEAGATASTQAIAAAEAAQLKADTLARDAHGELQKLAGQLAERESGIPADLADPQKLQAAQAAAVTLREQLRTALAAATQAAQRAAERVVDLGARREAADKQQSLYAAAVAQKTGELAERLAAAGFADLAAWRAAALDDAGIEALAQGLGRFEAALKAADERAGRAAEATRELARPDLAALEQASQQARAAQLAAAKAVRDAVGQRETTRGFIASLERLGAEYRDIEARYKLLQEVSDVANGRNAQRMSFQRYVLATLLEEVLVATTARLKVMSRGRYEMRRRIEATDQRAAAGLDLEIFDHYTGMTRPVATLSGGESFLASLALALGLSDVVQSGAGGIRLDAIFVDEGFGSLDPEALDFAIRALKDLQRAGRMVGIISHVAELKEWIDARLELRPTPKGSVAVFVG